MQLSAKHINLYTRLKYRLHKEKLEIKYKSPWKIYQFQIGPFSIMVHFHHGLNYKQKEKIYTKKNQGLIKNGIFIC